MSELALRLTEVIDAYDGHLLPRDILVLEAVRDGIERVEQEREQALDANRRLRKTPQKAELQERVARLTQERAAQVRVLEVENARMKRELKEFNEAMPIWEEDNQRLRAENDALRVELVQSVAAAKSEAEQAREATKSVEVYAAELREERNGAMDTIATRDMEIARVREKLAWPGEALSTETCPLDVEVTLVIDAWKAEVRKARTDALRTLASATKKVLDAHDIDWLVASIQKALGDAQRAERGGQ